MLVGLRRAKVVLDRAKGSGGLRRVGVKALMIVKRRVMVAEVLRQGFKSILFKSKELAEGDMKSTMR